MAKPRFYAGPFDEHDLVFYVGADLRTLRILRGDQAPADCDPAGLSSDWVDAKPSFGKPVGPVGPVDAPVAPPTTTTP